jgi:hypothetical protein
VNPRVEYIGGQAQEQAKMTDDESTDRTNEDEDEDGNDINGGDMNAGDDINGDVDDINGDADKDQLQADMDATFQPGDQPPFTPSPESEAGKKPCKPTDNFQEQMVQANANFNAGPPFSPMMVTRKCKQIDFVDEPSVEFLDDLDLDDEMMGSDLLRRRIRRW